MNRRTLVGAILATALVVVTIVIYSPQVSERTITLTTTETIGGSTHTVTEYIPGLGVITTTETTGGSIYTVIFIAPGRSASTTTTTSLAPAQIEFRSASGSQPVLCSWASYFIPDTITSANASEPVSTIAIVGYYNYTMTIFEVNEPGSQTTTAMGVFVSATNVTQPEGYVTSSTTYPNYIPSYGWTTTTCTYLP